MALVLMTVDGLKFRGKLLLEMLDGWTVLVTELVDVTLRMTVVVESVGLMVELVAGGTVRQVVRVELWVNVETEAPELANVKGQMTEGNTTGAEALLLLKTVVTKLSPLYADGSGIGRVVVRVVVRVEV